MIVKPTVKELLNHAENRYELVIATSKRARQIEQGEEKLTDVDSESSVTIAANEINEGKVEIVRENLIEKSEEESVKTEEIENK